MEGLVLMMTKMVVEVQSENGAESCEALDGFNANTSSPPIIDEQTHPDR